MRHVAMNSDGVMPEECPSLKRKWPYSKQPRKCGEGSNINIRGTYLATKSTDKITKLL